MIDKLSWISMLPETFLLIMACVIALLDLGVKTPRRTLTYGMTMLTLAVLASLQLFYANSGHTSYGVGNMVVSDVMGNWLKFFE